jgi:hypothetical protein
MRKHLRQPTAGNPNGIQFNADPNPGAHRAADRCRDRVLAGVDVGLGDLKADDFRKAGQARGPCSNCQCFSPLLPGSILMSIQFFLFPLFLINSIAIRCASSRSFDSAQSHRTIAE